MTKELLEKALQLYDKQELLQKQLEIVNMQKGYLNSENKRNTVVSEDFNQLILAILQDNPEGVSIVNSLFDSLKTILTRQIAECADEFSKL